MRRRIAFRALAAAAAVSATALAAEGACRAYHRLRCQAHGPDGRFELYSVGESTALGEPYWPAVTVGALVERALGGAVRGKPIVTIDLARQGESIYPQAEAAELALCCRNPGVPGALFVYAGHNDAFFSDSFDEERAELFEQFKEDVLFRSRLIKDAFVIAERNDWIPRVRSIQTFEFNLRRVIEASRRAGLVPILSTTASNVADMDPGLLPDLAGPRAASIVSKGAALESRGRWEEALAYDRKASDAHPELDGYLRYRRGRIELRLGRERAAAALLRACIEARAQDNFGRARTEQNELVRRLAREYAIPLVDFERIAERASPHGLPGDGLFSDGHHPNLKGYALLSNALAEAVAGAFGERVRAPLKISDRLPDELGLSRNDQVNALVESGRWLFSVGFDHAYPLHRWRMAEDRFRRAAALDPDAFDPRMGLALAAAVRKKDFAADADWLDREGFFYGAVYDFPEEDWPEILRRLRAADVPKPLLGELTRTYALRRRGVAAR
ncbi:MAG TPA: hypothetical protein VN915_12540 [Elusimicrobiota bacterium]|nr:hypothetical protein [Elusimicrobiota bacterium]